MPAERDERLEWEIVETELPPLRDRLAALSPSV